jgi:hypothetical protein
MLRVDLAVEIQLTPRRDRVLLGQLLPVFLPLDDLETFLEHYKGAFSPDAHRRERGKVDWL